VQGVRRAWPQVLAALRQQNLRAEALVKSGSLLGVKNNVLYLGFSEVLRQKMETGDNLTMLRQALSQALQLEVEVRCVVAAGKRSELPPDIENDGLVATALRDLGGEIVDVN
jgi:hypothetical protein